MRTVRFLALLLAFTLVAFSLPAFAAPAAPSPAYQAAVKRFMELTSKQDIAALKDQKRGANDRVPKLVYEIESYNNQNVNARKALREALRRNGYKSHEHTLTFQNIYSNWHSLKTHLPAALSPANMAAMKNGGAATVTSHHRATSKQITQTLEADHIVPVHHAPELGTQLHNLKLLAKTPNRSIRDLIPEMAMSRANDLVRVGMFSKERYETLKLHTVTMRNARQADLARDATRGEVSALPPRPAQVTQGQYSAPSRENARQQIDRYGTIPGGVLLEGALAGVPPITAARFAPASNELLLNGRLRYVLPIPKSTAAEIFAAVARDDRIGVSLPGMFETGLNEIYGALPATSWVARDLTLADAFLGAIVFPDHPGWLDNYQLAPGHVREDTFTTGMSVNFTIHGFEAEIRDNRLLVPRSRFTVTFVPHEAGPNGEAIPLDSPERVVSAKLTASGQHVANNIAHYRREPIIDLAFQYGEVAALARKLRESGANLAEIAASIR
jgi:hypothetical protein